MNFFQASRNLKFLFCSIVIFSLTRPATSADKTKELSEYEHEYGEYPDDEPAPPPTGEPVDPKVNFVVGIIKNDTLVCEGAIVSNFYIVTAGHCCFTDYEVDDPTEIKLSIGNHNWKEGEMYNVAEYVVHEKYHEEPHTVDNDVAVLKTDREIEFNDAVSQIAMHQAQIDAEKFTSATVFGWERDAQGVVKDALSSNDVMTFPQKDCKQYYHEWTEDTFCATDAKEACNTEDVGTPICFKENGVYSLIGFAASGTVMYCDDDVPDLYVSISSHFDWISEKIASN